MAIERGSFRALLTRLWRSGSPVFVIDMLRDVHVNTTPTAIIQSMKTELLAAYFGFEARRKSSGLYLTWFLKLWVH